MSTRISFKPKTAWFLLALLILLPWSIASAYNRPSGWSKHPNNPVFDVGVAGRWDDQWVYDPCVIHISTMYYMFYTGNSSNSQARIGFATSPDGLTWTRYSSTPALTVGQEGSWDSVVVRNPTIVKDGGLYKMWYSGRDANNKNRVGYAVSSDLIVWIKDTHNPVLDMGASGEWDDAQIREPTVVKVGSTYYMWYVGKKLNGGQAIGMATSADGIAWTKYANNPVFEPSPGGSWDYSIYSPHVIYDGNLYHLRYSGANYGGTAWEVGYATSPDGIQWTQRGRVLQQGPDGAFDRYSADYATVVLIGQEFKMWYSGIGADNHYRVGYAIAPLLTFTEQVHLPLQLRKAGYCNPTWADDFSDYHTGWPEVDNNDVKTAYLNGEYQILGKATDAAFWYGPGVEMTDGAILVDLRFASAGNNADNGGIMFGQALDEADNFYRVGLQRRGYYFIQRHTAGVAGWQTLSSGPAGSFLPYPATNRLKLVRNGASISAYLNGQPLATISDNTYIGSLRVGLSAGSSASNEDLRFDNFAIYSLRCAAQAQ